MTYPDDLSTIVNNLAIARKKMSDIEKEIQKVDRLQAEIDTLTARLVKICESAGLPAEAVELLLAAR